MKLIVCVDDEMGMAFNHRRVSSDSVVTREIQRIVGSAKIWMSCYSAKLFLSVFGRETEGAQSMHIMLSDNPSRDAGKNDYCFLEQTSPYNTSDIDEIILFRWGRRYPSDVKFGIKLSEGWSMTKSQKIVGTSHKEILHEVWEKINIDES